MVLVSRPFIQVPALQIHCFFVRVGVSWSRYNTTARSYPSMIRCSSEPKPAGTVGRMARPGRKFHLFGTVQ